MIQHLKNIFIEDDLKSLLGWMGINYKKAQKNRVLTSIIIGSIIILLGIFYKKVYLLLLGIVITYVIYKYQYYKLKKQHKKVIELKKRMFPSFVKKVLILIRTNNVYNALVQMIEYTDNPIKQYLKELIDEIEVDKSIKPFNDFADKMEFIEAYQVMSMLYTFNEHAMNKKHLISLEKMISNLYDNEIDDIIETKKRALWLYPNFVILSMLAFIFALAIYMFISVIGSMNF